MLSSARLLQRGISSLALRRTSVLQMPLAVPPTQFTQLQNTVKPIALPQMVRFTTNADGDRDLISALMPKKFIEMIGYKFQGVTSSLPEQAWNMSIHLFRKTFAISKCIELLSDPSTANTPEVQDEIKALMVNYTHDTPDMSLIGLQKEHTRLGPLVHVMEIIVAKRAELVDLMSMLADADTELQAALKEVVLKNSANPGCATPDTDEGVQSWAPVVDQTKAEIDLVKTTLEELENEALDYVLPKDVDDFRNAILEVRPGTGGDEAMLFARDVFNMYERLSGEMGWRFQVIDTQTTDTGGYREASATIQGDGVFGWLKFETGVHRVQRIPTTETMGRVHTSTMTVAILPEVKEVDIVIRDCDIRVDVYRSSGAGGQHVNTTESAVRLTHIPTNTVVCNQDERSQHKNKDKAMNILRARIYEAQRQKIAEERARLRGEQIGSGDRSERIRTYNFPQSRVTDHRVNVTMHSVDAFMAAETLPEMLEQLKQKERMDILSSALKAEKVEEKDSRRKGKQK